MSMQDRLCDLYARTADPWSFESSWYEQRKYALTLASLPQARYRSAYEPGCSIGVLTRLLADRCDTIIASDFVPAALERARARTRGLDHVRIVELETPREWPTGSFDLIVVSELAYFLQPDQVGALGRRIAGSLSEDGTVVMVHWTGPIDAWAIPAAQAHERLAAEAGLTRSVRLADEQFLLEVYGR